mgnify:CR=1 FL=1
MNPNTRNRVSVVATIVWVVAMALLLTVNLWAPKLSRFMSGTPDPTPSVSQSPLGFTGLRFATLDEVDSLQTEISNLPGATYAIIKVPAKRTKYSDNSEITVHTTFAPSTDTYPTDQMKALRTTIGKILWAKDYDIGYSKLSIAGSDGILMDMGPLDRYKLNGAYGTASPEASYAKEHPSKA